jgi:hypothetical protein
LANGSFRAALEAFCDMHGIIGNFTDYWTDLPDVVEPGYVSTASGEEVP